MQIRARPLRTLAEILMISVAASPSRIKDPVGVQAIVERVEIGSQGGEGATIRIFGVFAVGVPHPNMPGKVTYHIGRGYLYYHLNPRDPVMSRSEWSLIAAAAGSGEAIAFGARGGKNGQLRVPSSKESEPDPYPLGLGFSRPPNGSLVGLLVNATAPVFPAPNDTIATGSVRLVAWPAVTPGLTYSFEVEGSGIRILSGTVTPTGTEIAWTSNQELAPRSSYSWRVWPQNAKRPARGWTFYTK
jgi:hypothetical protein